MDEDQYQIEFSYNGQEYSAIVTPESSKKNHSYVVQYTLSMSRQFEKTVELCRSEDLEDSDIITWVEQPDEDGQLPTTHALVQIIGQAIEEYE